MDLQAKIQIASLGHYAVLCKQNYYKSFAPLDDLINHRVMSCID